uniref:8.9 kDa family member n=1 Tax=Rhipicephalus zambeziensis TaxID=60191 RepID=A0A224Y1C8_9ACAR
MVYLRLIVSLAVFAAYVVSQKREDVLEGPGVVLIPVVVIENKTCIVSSDLNMTEGESIEKNIFCRRTTCEASKGFLKEEHCTVPKNYTLSKMHIEPKGGEFPYCCPWFSARRK